MYLGGSGRKRIVPQDRSVASIEKYNVQSEIQSNNLNSQFNYSRITGNRISQQESNDDISFDSDDKDDVTTNSALPRTQPRTQPTTTTVNRPTLRPSQHQTNQPTQNRYQQQQQQQQQSVLSKINPFKWISYLFMSIDLSALSSARNSFFNPNDKTSKCRTLAIVLITSILFILAVCGLLALSGSGILRRLSNETHSYNNTPGKTETIYIEKELKKENLFPLIAEYINTLDLKGINNRIDAIQKKIDELSQNKLNYNEFHHSIHQLKDQFDQVKKEIVGVEEINEIVQQSAIKSSDKEQLLQQVSNDIKRVASEKLELFDREYNSKVGDLHKQSNEIMEDQRKKINDINMEYNEKVKGLTQISERFLKEQQEKTQRLKDELNQQSSDNKKLLVQEYSVLTDKLTQLTKEMTKSIEKDTQEWVDSTKRDISKDLTTSLQKDTDNLYKIHQQLSIKYEQMLVFIKENPDIKSLQTSMSSLESLRSLIDDALEIYSADKLAKPDYALYEAGACIEYKCLHYPVSKTYPPDPVDQSLLASAISWFVPRDRPNPPETILEPSVLTGTCWGFNGSEGQVAVRLSEPIVVTEVSIDHINSKIAHHITSSLKEFRVWGLKNITEVGVDLGTFTYQTDINRHVQTFQINNPTNQVFSHVVLQALSNYGYPYTCIYRFRVHGDRVTPENTLSISNNIPIISEKQLQEETL
ncbi:SUN domain-containing protein 1 [Tieghemostelium lacteum]|uniref:SUN domain-containing protein 1 n=1 Tax=Tieghemostelium lacteum TaxID=361077 RepID=A0A152A508_TIELA|nr:SUN domain-containing protein 1 [Tieghemostelium lacteum]|eukprot:KYR01145.1 SUN domain-containing protein 1 [Tieghemostelium lacteum]